MFTGVLPGCLTVSVSRVPLFIRTGSHWIRTHSNNLILTGSPAKALFANKVTLIGVGDQDFNLF